MEIIVNKLCKLPIKYCDTTKAKVWFQQQFRNSVGVILTEIDPYL